MNTNKNAKNTLARANTHANAYANTHTHKATRTHEAWMDEVYRGLTRGGDQAGRGGERGA